MVLLRLFIQIQHVSYSCGSVFFRKIFKSSLTFGLLCMSTAWIFIFTGNLHDTLCGCHWYTERHLPALRHYFPYPIIRYVITYMWPQLMEQTVTSLDFCWIWMLYG